VNSGSYYTYLIHPLILSVTAHVLPILGVSTIRADLFGKLLIVYPLSVIPCHLYVEFKTRYILKRQIGS
jgi:hypothetical protein